MKYLVKINVQDPELETVLQDAANDYFVPVHMFRNQTTTSGVETTTIVFVHKKPQPARDYVYVPHVAVE